MASKSVGFIFNNRDLNDLRTEINSRGAGGYPVMREVLTDIADEAVGKMIQTIETTPSAFVPGKSNRVDTGTMRDAVQATEIQREGSHISVRFGWTGTKEDYFLWQEQGADNPSAIGGRISPMHALLGAFIWAREELVERITDLRGMGKR